MIKLDFMIRVNRGRRCRVNKRWFRWLKELSGFVKLGTGPCCVEVNRISEYAAAINVARASIGVKRCDRDRMDVIRMISLSRFIDGGAPRLAAEDRNHHVDKEGNKVSIPFVRRRLRV